MAVPIKRNIAIVVDDTPITRMLVAYTARHMGFSDIKEFENGKDALEGIKRLSKDEKSRSVIITDYDMPEMTGNQLAEELAKENIKIPIMLHSSTIKDERKSILDTLVMEGALNHYQIKTDDIQTGISTAIENFEKPAPAASPASEKLDEVVDGNPTKRKIAIVVDYNSEDNATVAAAKLVGLEDIRRYDSPPKALDAIRAMSSDQINSAVLIMDHQTGDKSVELINELYNKSIKLPIMLQTTNPDKPLSQDKLLTRQFIGFQLGGKLHHFQDKTNDIAATAEGIQKAINNFNAKHQAADSTSVRVYSISTLPRGIDGSDR